MYVRIAKCIPYLMLISFMMVAVGCNQTNNTQSPPTQPIQIQQRDPDLLDTLSIIRQAENVLRQQLGENATICVHRIEYDHFPQDVILKGSFLIIEYIVGTTLYRAEYGHAHPELRFREIPEYGVPCYAIDVAQIDIWPKDIIESYPEAAIWNIQLSTNAHTENWEYPQSRDHYWWIVKADEHDPSVFYIDVKNGDVFTSWEEP